MGVVHSLEGDAGIIAVEVAVLDEILDSVDHLERSVDVRPDHGGCD